MIELPASPKTIPTGSSSCVGIRVRILTSTRFGAESVFAIVLLLEFRSWMGMPFFFLLELRSWMGMPLRDEVVTLMANTSRLVLVLVLVLVLGMRQ